MNQGFNKKLENVLDSFKVGFHVPGHNRGKIFEKLGYESTFSTQMDTTEIPGTDNLFQPESFIKESQERASKWFKSIRTHFLVNGSTCGNYAMLHSACKPGDSVIIGRDSHRSVYNGLLLGDLNPIYMYPEVQTKDQLPLGYEPEELDRLLHKHPNVKAVHITRPNYYGVCSDIDGIVKVCRKYDVLLLVDEAHGAHLHLSTSLPISAVEAGADMVVQSIHKTLPSLTQTSLLHVCSNRVDLKRLDLMLQIHQSTSPSYLLMSAIDQAVDIIEKHGYNLMKELISHIENFKNELRAIPQVSILDNVVSGYQRDQSKLVFGFVNHGISGMELECILREQYGIQLEMSNAFYGVGVSTISHEKEDFDQLLEAIKNIASSPKGTFKSTPSHMFPKTYDIGRSIRQSIYSPCETVLLDEANGRLSCEFVIPYPPGVPVLIPGERITAEKIDYLKTLYSEGYTLIGLSDKAGNSIDVIDQKEDLHG